VLDAVVMQLRILNFNPYEQQKFDRIYPYPEVDPELQTATQPIVDHETVVTGYWMYLKSIKRSTLKYLE
jgi:hypothetical protein